MPPATGAMRLFCFSFAWCFSPAGQNQPNVNESRKGYPCEERNKGVGRERNVESKRTPRHFNRDKEWRATTGTAPAIYQLYVP
jgi:hypothetical protein